jgi:hypothetical protein
MEDLDHIGEIRLWNKFKKYNRVKYIFLFFIGFLCGIILMASIYLVI